ncbi:transmembrane glucosamine N-acetyltransferase NagX [Paraferrimonas haliotis]|uniref:DUF5009 domain-containing protein n=1 Tax=Paraferrimonas haliotis TaxID=2013866 RepID=A0AA37U039_9GAMM|nr:DUF5009 domain-containing protein [Paraferrimonas haliotis]GLS84056.1 DUF5009 domain-containing protein [Paraferrimonas haliotis]
MATDNPKKRLASLDALRGFDMIWIMGAEALFLPLFVLTGFTVFDIANTHMHHAQWHGFRAYDLIFPLFIFISGVTLGLSAKSINDLPWVARVPIYRKAVVRLMLLLALGVLYNHGWGTGLPTRLEEVRFASVLGRIGLAWFVAAMVVWHCPVRWQWRLPWLLLIGYSVWQSVIPVPGYSAGLFSETGSWNTWFDQHFLIGITYQNKPLDPEGIFSTLGAIINALAGVCLGRWIQSNNNTIVRQAGVLLIVGAALIALAWLASVIIPINKTLWTGSFSLMTIGWSVILFAVFYAIVDGWQVTAWAKPFFYIGTNAILIYLLTAWMDWGYLANSFIGHWIASWPDAQQQLASVSAVLLLQILFLRWLYLHRVFVKV